MWVLNYLYKRGKKIQNICIFKNIGKGRIYERQILFG